MSFVVIEGIDGAGKSTQIDFLRNFLKTKEIAFEYIHFPTTDSEIYGDLISRFLRGELGSISEVNPYLVSLLFAGDRNNMSNTIRQWIDDGKFVLNDRYIYSNIGFQCAKTKTVEEANDLFKWIFNLEYEYFKIPKPDLSILLDVPFSFTEVNLKNRIKDKDREYLKGKIDIHEADFEFQKKVRNTYLKAVEEDENFIKITCSDSNDNILSPKEISDLIIAEIEKRSLI